MGLKFILSLVLLAILAEIVLTDFNVPTSYTPSKLIEGIDEEITRLAMSQEVDINAIGPTKEEMKNTIKNFRLSSEKANNEETYTKPRCGACPSGWIGSNSKCECVRYLADGYIQRIRSNQYDPSNYICSIVNT
jgi:hypothetical protein